MTPRSTSSFQNYQAIFGEIAKKAGWPAVTRRRFEQLARPAGALVVGDAREVAEKIAYVDHVLGGVARFNLQMSVGPAPYIKRLRTIELLGREVSRRLVAAAWAARSEAAIRAVLRPRRDALHGDSAAPTVELLGVQGLQWVVRAFGLQHPHPLAV